MTYGCNAKDAKVPSTKIFYARVEIVPFSTEESKPNASSLVLPVHFSFAGQNETFSTGSIEMN